jgi:antagonist of KipI
MRIIEVQTPGLFTTVQDLGRPGFGPIGVSASGAADPIALRLGNLLVGNPEGAAALEFTLLGGSFLFPDGAVLALTGSDFGATLNGQLVAPWTVAEAAPGATLRVGHTRSGARCYLCVRGSVVVPAFLGSSSTHVLSGLGGFEGRPLRKRDVLPIGPEPLTPPKRRLLPDVLSRFERGTVLRVTEGPQSDMFPESCRSQFLGSVYRVGEESNRVGLRLQGAPLDVPTSGRMITEGVALGSIQIPPGGQPVILFVEQQTTGGYPKIANVISADLASIGQLRPGDEIRFERIAMCEARKLLREQEALIASKEIFQ